MKVLVAASKFLAFIVSDGPVWWHLKINFFTLFINYINFVLSVMLYTGRGCLSIKFSNSEISNSTLFRESLIFFFEFFNACNLL